MRDQVALLLAQAANLVAESQGPPALYRAILALERRVRRARQWWGQ